MRGCVFGSPPSTGASDCGKPASFVGSKNIELMLPLELYRGKEAHRVHSCCGNPLALKTNLKTQGKES